MKNFLEKNLMSAIVIAIAIIFLVIFIASKLIPLQPIPINLEMCAKRCGESGKLGRMVVTSATARAAQIKRKEECICS